jgi:hypothetical protein
MADQAKLPESNEVVIEGILKAKAASTGGMCLITEAGEVWINDSPKDIFEKIGKGDKVRFKGVKTNRGYTYAGLIEHIAAEKDEGMKLDDYLSWAHSHGLVKILTEYIKTENDGRVIFRATAIFKDGKEFSAHGDAKQDEVTTDMQKHYVRFGESRAVARCLRFANGDEEDKKK